MDTDKRSLTRLHSIIAAVLTAAGIVVLGLCIRSGLASFSDNARTVTVRGLCEKEVMADKVTWPIVSKLVGNDLTAIYADIESIDSAITGFLESNGVKDTEIAVNPPKVVDLQADRYNQTAGPYRYNVTTVVVVTSSDVAKINSLMQRQTELMRRGIAIEAGDYSYQTTYEYTGLNSIKPAMIAEATKNAREAAKKFAEDSESRLGKIKSASQGQFSIDDRDQYTPYIKKVRVVSTIDYYLRD